MTTAPPYPPASAVHPEEVLGVPSTMAKRNNFWRRGAPRGVAKDEGWHTWNAYLSNRDNRRCVGSILKCKTPPLLWGLAGEAVSEETRNLAALCHKHIRKPPRSLIADQSGLVETLADWREEIDQQSGSVDFAIDTLSIATSLPWLAGKIASQFWWELLDGLWHVVGEMGNTEPTVERPPVESLTQQMLAAELPLTLAAVLPEIRPIHQMRPAAVAQVAAGLEELLNGDGLPHGTHVGVLLPLLACWTRCRVIAREMPKTKWKNSVQAQYELAVRQALRWSGSDGSALVSDPIAGPWSAEFLTAAMDCGGDASDMAGARAQLPKKLLRSLDVEDGYAPPEPSDHCEWSGLAVLRTEWSPRATVAAIDFSMQAMRIDCRHGASRLLDGVIRTEIEIDSATALPEGDWDVSCWMSDDDVDYLELSLMLSCGAQLDRQILLAREEEILYLCDSLLTDGPARLRHKLRLPLAGGVKAEPADETRELVLRSGNSAVRAMPLALPEWRADKGTVAGISGELTTGADALELTHTRQARRMSCPLLLDLSGKRLAKECTWRQLTVAEHLEIQPPEVATGYRAQAGKHQWVFYRSLAPRANRTLLGQNTSSETLIGRFISETGELDELVEVEG